LSSEVQNFTKTARYRRNAPYGTTWPTIPANSLKL
jgi:hypothetical protein